MRRSRKKVSVRNKQHRISLRPSERDLAVIDRAACLLGRSRAEFVRESAVQAAKSTLRELPSDAILPPRLDLSAASFAKVARLTKKPRKPGKALRSLMAGRPDDDNDGS